ncbi:MAG: hypothetical protein ACE5NW_11220 [Acidiferrobacterales bacterium]
MKSSSYWLLAITILVCTSIAAPSRGDADRPQALRIDYQKIRDELRDSIHGIPVYTRSEEHKDLINAEVYGVLGYPLEKLAKILATPANWCEFATLHPNVKACTYAQRHGQALLTLHLDRKTRASIEHAFVIKLRYRIGHLDEDYFTALLEGDKGPLGTRNHRFQLEAVAVEDKTFVRVSFSYRWRLIGRMATTVYLAMRGHDTVGFSTVGVDDKGYPIYVKGKKAMMERNVMRCYFALRAFMDTQHLTASERFEARISYWFDLAEKYFPKPYDMEREEYVEVKRQERRNRVELSSERRVAQPM